VVTEIELQASENDDTFDTFINGNGDAINNIMLQYRQQYR